MSDFWHILLFCPKQTVVLSEPEITFFSSYKSRSDKDKVYIYVAKSYWLTVITILYFYIIYCITFLPTTLNQANSLF